MPPAPSSSSGSSDGAIFDRAAVTSLLAGAAAGMVSDGVTHPISTAKSRLQVTKVAAGARPPSTSAILLGIIRNEGWTRLYAGFGTVTIAAPARAMYFLGYELSRRQGDKLFGVGHAATSFLSGPVAQLSGSLLWVPMDVVKERLQIQKSAPAPASAASAAAASAAAAPSIATAASASSAHHGSAVRFTGSWHAATTILKTEGIRGWYRGYWAHQCVWGPFNAVYFTGYEFLKQQWTARLNPPRAGSSSLHEAPARVENFANDGTPLPELHKHAELVQLPTYAFPICGAISGCLAAAATAPLDLVKTRLQTQGSSGQYSGAIDCALKIIKHEGASSMMRGLGARCLWLSPNIALTMSVYEFVTRQLKERNLV